MGRPRWRKDLELRRFYSGTFIHHFEQVQNAHFMDVGQMRQGRLKPHTQVLHVADGRPACVTYN